MINQNTKIEFAYASDEKYIKLMITSLISVMEHSNKSRKYVCHYFYNNVTKKSLKKLELIAKKYKNLELKVYNRAFLNLDKELNDHGRYSQSSFDRLKMPDFLIDTKKLLYIDSDSYVVNDIAKIFDIELGDYYSAVCENYTLGEFVNNKVLLKKDNIKNNKWEHLTWDKYTKDVLQLENPSKLFCSGLLLINCKKFREDNIGEKTINFIEKIEPIFPDQCALNKILGNNVLYIDPWVLTSYYELSINKWAVYNEHVDDIIVYSVKPAIAEKYNFTEYLNTFSFVNRYKLPIWAKLEIFIDSLCTKFKSLKNEV